MNLELSDEQTMLREAAREALARLPTLGAAREALDRDMPIRDLWPTAVAAGWPSLLIDEARGGAGLDAFEAMLILEECGRVLAGAGLLGHLPACAILAASRSASVELLEPLASGEQRAAYLPVRPPNPLPADRGDDAHPPAVLEGGWSVDPARGLVRGQAPRLERRAGGDLRVNGRLWFVPDAPGADLLVGVGLLEGEPTGFAVRGSDDRLTVEPLRRFDATRPLGNVGLERAEALALDVPADGLGGAWHLAQALIASESVGSVQSALDSSLAYARERFTFGRPIGSYQAIKHALTEILRGLENGRSLLYYAGWARTGAPDEFALAANAARSVAGRAFEGAARTMISVHGGIGATWEHDAPLYLRRAQLSRRLLGGTSGASERVGAELLARVGRS